MSLKVAMDVTKSDSFVKSYTARQGEADDTIQFVLYENGSLINNSDISSAKLRAETPLGHYIETDVSKVSTYLEVKLTKNINAEVGYFKRFYLEIKRTSSGKTITTPDLIYFVLPDASITGGNAQDYISRVEELINSIQSKYDEYLANIDANYLEELSQLNKQFETVKTQLSQEVTNFKKMVDGQYIDLQTKVTQLSKSVNELTQQLNTLVIELNKALEDFQKGNFYTKEESSANVINIITGKKEVEMTFTFDFINKNAGSTLENPNIFKRVYAGAATPTEILAPDRFPTEINQAQYDLIKDLDQKVYTLTGTNAGAVVQFNPQYNIVELMKKKLGESFFVDQGANDLASQVTVVRRIFKEMYLNTWGYGSGPNGNKINIATTNKSSSSQWVGTRSHSDSTTKKLSLHITENIYISDEGLVYGIIYSEQSDGITQSVVNVDCSNLVFTIRLSMSEYIKYVIAAYHGENLATVAEAESGINSSKIMTPKTTKAAIDKFQQGSGTPSAEVRTYLLDSGSNSGFISSGAMEFRRSLNSVHVIGQFKTSKSIPTFSYLEETGPTWLMPAGRTRVILQEILNEDKLYAIDISPLQSYMRIRTLAKTIPADTEFIVVASSYAVHETAGAYSQTMEAQTLLINNLIDRVDELGGN